MTLVITHATVTNAVADPTAIVDGPAWDANHTLTGVVSPSQGGTGVVNNDSSTVTISGSFGTTFTVTAATSVTLPTTGTLATLAGTEELTNKTLNASVAKGTWTASGTWTIPAVTLGGTVSGGGNQINNVIIGTNTPLAGSFTSLAYSTTLTGTSTNASALAVGRQGATDPVLLVDASTASVATGVKVKGAAAAGGVAVSAISSGTNENLTVDAKGSGTITLGGTSTGNIVVSRALNYGGVTLSNAVTGTGNMVLATSPALTTPNIGVASGTSLSLTGLISAGAFTNSLGGAGTGTTPNLVNMQGASGTGGGSSFQFYKNSVLQWQFGEKSAAYGSASGNFLLYAQIAGVNALDISSSDGSVNFGATTASTSTATGAVTVAGGLGVAGDIFSKSVNMKGATNGLSIDDRANGNSHAWTWYATGNVMAFFSTSGSADRLQIADSDGAVTVPSTTASTSSSTGALKVSGGVGIAGSAFLGGALGTKTPQTLTGTSGTVAATESAAIFNASGTFTATLPAAGTYPGRWLYVKNIAAQTVNSASSNVVPVAGGSAGTALLTATAGKWAILQSNGTNWEIFASN